jgi:hypothetical protein
MRINLMTGNIVVSEFISLDSVIELGLERLWAWQLDGSVRSGPGRRQVQNRRTRRRGRSAPEAQDMRRLCERLAKQQERVSALMESLPKHLASHRPLGEHDRDRRRPGRRGGKARPPRARENYRVSADPSRRCLPELQTRIVKCATAQVS